MQGMHEIKKRMKEKERDDEDERLVYKGERKK